MKIFLILLIKTLYRFVAPILVIIPILFMKEVQEPLSGKHYNQPNIKRYKLPKYFSWMETPDELLPCGMYEPTCEKIYNKFGKYVASWYWIGLRNVGHGISWTLGKEVPKKIKSISTLELQQFGLFTTTYKVLGIKFMLGWKTYNDWYRTKTVEGYWAVPFVTIRFNKE